MSTLCTNFPIGRGTGKDYIVQGKMTLLNAPIMAPHARNPAEITPEKWRHFYLYTLSRLVTATIKFTELLSDARGPRKLPAMSPMRRREFLERLIDELVSACFMLAAWADTGSQRAGLRRVITWLPLPIPVAWFIAPGPFIR